MALLAQLDRGRPFVKLGEQSRLNLLELPLNPLFVVVSQHRSNYKGNHSIPHEPNFQIWFGGNSLFLSTTYLRPIPHLTAKPRFSPIR
jgi:hypothetical protein